MASIIILIGTCIGECHTVILGKWFKASKTMRKFWGWLRHWIQELKLVNEY